MNLTTLANRYQSDKGTEFGSPPHRYTYLYDLLFHPYRRSRINVLELGLAIGGPELGGPLDRRVDSPSVSMWLEYFSEATIFGFDICDFSHISHPRFNFVRGDLGSESDLRRLADAAPAFDIIIDDASHASYHQQLALKVLFPRLSYEGLYVIEDLHWQSPYFENNMPAVPKTSAFLVNYFERGQYQPNVLFSEADIDLIGAATASFAAFTAFDGSCNGTKMIVLRKKGRFPSP